MSLGIPHPTDRLAALFDRRGPLIGNLHLPPLPGAPAYAGQSLDDICALAVEDTLTLVRSGFDGIIVENAGDLPYARPEHIGPETVAALTVVTREVRRAAGVPVGVICVANAVVPSLAVAKAAGAEFVRANIWVTSYVANEGQLDGVAAEALRYAASIGARDVLVLADVKVKFGAHTLTADRSLAEVSRDIQMYCADAVVVTGTRTGSPTGPEDVREVTGAVDLPVLVGSGLAPDNAAELLAVADGAIVGAFVKRDGKWWNPVDPARAEALVAAARAAEPAGGRP
ncbi:BtpA/SgcQ family protein [Pseudonocardia aurantiaca]|uniref:BtpA/SgcQ family protein n=1 Tax=Pseudonocardia aurantiaca TaxID=75290 RepID=A0ABW4FDE3_9PSEU